MKMMDEIKNELFKVLFFEHGYFTLYVENKNTILGIPLKHSSRGKLVSKF